jgi:hypothetical protein
MGSGDEHRPAHDQPSQVLGNRWPGRGWPEDMAKGLQPEEWPDGLAKEIVIVKPTGNRAKGF